MPFIEIYFVDCIGGQSHLVSRPLHPLRSIMFFNSPLSKHIFL